VSDIATTVVVPMPHMGVSVEEGTVIEWLKSVGEEVAAEEAICAIATDKVDTEVLAPADGVLAKQLAAEGDNVPVGEPLAEMVPGGEGVAVGSPDATRRDEGSADASGAGGASRGVSGEPTATPSSGTGRQSLVADSATNLGHETGAGLAERAAAGRDEFGRFDPRKAAEAVLSFAGTRTAGGGSNGAAVLASPVARRMAAERGVDLGAVEGSGQRGRIRKRDVEAAIAGGAAGGGAPESASTRPSAGGRPASAGRPRPEGPQLDADGLPAGYADVPHEVVESSRVRVAIAEHMSRSRRTAAHMTTEVDVDLSAVVRARTELNRDRLAAGEPKLSYLPLLARAACVALGEYPELNATFLGETSIRWQAVNLGVAVDTPQGLLVPVVRDCDRLTAPAIGAAIADLAARARDRKLTPDDLAGGTFTLSNPGSVGAVSAPAIINQPQVAILGVPTIQRRPWVVVDEHGEESISIRSILRLAVTFDHRALDGADATRFAVALKDHLESWATEAYT